MRMFGQIPPDLTLTRAEIAAEKALWRGLEERAALLRATLEATHKLISEAALTGFNPHDGDWAERLFANQGAVARALQTTATE